MLRKNIIVIDGHPGSGKTTFANKIKSYFSSIKLAAEIVGTDLDVLSRSDRGDKSVLEYHSGKIVKEVFKVFIGNQDDKIIKFTADVYSGETGEISDKKILKVPSINNGVLIVEGLTSFEHILSEAGKFSPNIKKQIQYILLESPLDEMRRFNRDTQIKKLPEKVIIKRINSQRLDLQYYNKDLIRYFRTKMHFFMRN